MKKKNLALFIDGENVPAKESKRIFQTIDALGELDYAKVYGIQKDMSTRAWSQQANDIPKLKDIRLSGGPNKNKVDRKIQEDITKELGTHKNIDIVVIATSDHGYVPVVKLARNSGKRVVIIGNRATSKKLMNECNEFICL